MKGPNTNWELLIVNYLCDWQVYVSCTEVGMSHWKLTGGVIASQDRIVSSEDIAPHFVTYWIK